MKSLKEQYSEALEQINNKITSYQSQIGVLQQGDTSDPVIASMIQSKAYQKQYQQALKDQISGILDTLNGKQFDSISDYLTQCYQNGFIGVAYDLASQGIPLIMPIDQAAVVQAISTNSKLSKGLYESLGENVSDMKKKVVQEITRGVASNLPYADIARNIAGRSNAGMNNSMRIARTEGQRIQNTAAYDAQVKAKEKGADVFKQWCAVLDGRTRDSHRQLDGKIVDVEEEFKIGGMPAMFPGDFGDPAEDCNCRCTILQRARWALDESELEALQERAEYYGLDKTEDFEEFKEKYLNASQQESESAQKSDENTSQEKAEEKEIKDSLENSDNDNIIKLQMNLFDESDPLYLDMFSIEEEAGFEDIGLHGSPDSVQKKIDGKLTNFTPKEFAKYLKENGYDGGDIRLASCSTGKGDNSFAQQLSKELGVKVKAPDDDVYYIPNEGVLFIGSPYQNTGKWRIFNNGVEE